MDGADADGAFIANLLVHVRGLELLLPCLGACLTCVSWFQQRLDSFSVLLLPVCSHCSTTDQQTAAPLCQLAVVSVRARAEVWRCVEVTQECELCCKEAANWAVRAARLRVLGQREGKPASTTVSTAVWAESLRDQRVNTAFNPTHLGPAAVDGLFLTTHTHTCLQ